MTGFPPAMGAMDGLRAVRRQIAAALHAATAGVRLIRREPKAFAAWIAIWLAAVTLTGVVKAFDGAAPADAIAYHKLGARFGPFAVLLITLFLLAWASTTQAVFRAVLQPDERRFFYLRLGADELRLAIMSLVTFLLIVIFGGVPAFLLLALASPIMQAAPDLVRYIAIIGAVATICVDVWVGVRLSLIAVETFAEGRFHLSAYWPLARSRFWYLILVYAACFMMLLVLGAVVGSVSAALVPGQSFFGQLQGVAPLRSTALLGLAGFYAVLFSASWVASTVLFCAAQAQAFRAITGAHIRRMPGF